MNDQRIRRLEIRHIKGVTNLEITVPDEGFEVAGENGAGKTTTLDAVQWAISGAKAVPGMPIQKGKESGEIRLETDDLIIIREFPGPNQMKTTIKGKEGGKYTQGDLNKIFDGFLDPTEFARMKVKDQVRELRSFVSPEILAKIEKSEEEIKQLEQERLFLGRTIGTEPEAVEEAEEVDVLNLTNKKSAAEKLFLEKEHAEHTINLAKDRIEELKAEIRGEEEKLQAAERRLSEINKAGIPDITAIDELINKASIINRQANAYKEYIKAREAYADKKKRYDAFNGKIKEAREKSFALSRSVKLPVENAEVTDDGIFINGIPLDQMSDSEQIMISARVAMAKNTKGRPLFIRHGEDLGNATYDKLKALCKEKGFQPLIATVGGGHSPEAIILEEGVRKDG